MERLKIGIVGCDGRMGRANIMAVLRSDHCELSGGTERAENPAIGTDLGTLVGLEPAGVVASANLRELAQKSDVLIEFTSPSVSLAHAEIAAESGAAMVIGTTGFSEAEREQLNAISTKTPIVFAPNMSLGVNLLLAVVEQVASALDQDFDAEIVEMHHRRKVDAPSGTAKALGEAIIRGRVAASGETPEEIFARDGITGARPRGSIGYATLRGGDVIGDHTAIFAGEGERVEISHKASSREIYSAGAMRAARWVRGKPNGLYGMKDVLGLS